MQKKDKRKRKRERERERERESESKMLPEWLPVWQTIYIASFWKDSRPLRVKRTPWSLFWSYDSYFINWKLISYILINIKTFIIARKHFQSLVTTNENWAETDNNVANLLWQGLLSHKFVIKTHIRANSSPGVNAFQQICGKVPTNLGKKFTQIHEKIHTCLWDNLTKW